MKDLIREVREKLVALVWPGTFIKQINHAYSHFSILFDAYHCDCIDNTPRVHGCSNWRWIKPEQIYSLPFHIANHTLFNQIHNGLA